MTQITEQMVSRHLQQQSAELAQMTIQVNQIAQVQRINSQIISLRQQMAAASMIYQPQPLLTSTVNPLALPGFNQQQLPFADLNQQQLALTIPSLQQQLALANFAHQQALANSVLQQQQAIASQQAAFYRQQLDATITQLQIADVKSALSQQIHLNSALTDYKFRQSSLLTHELSLAQSALIQQQIQESIESSTESTSTASIQNDAGRPRAKRVLEKSF